MQIMQRVTKVIGFFTPWPHIFAPFLQPSRLATWPTVALPRFQGREAEMDLFLVASGPTWGKVEPGTPHDFHQSSSIFINLHHYIP
jgi:hypothetical protein